MNIVNPDSRIDLRQLFHDKPCLRVLEAHSPISAMLAKSVRLEARGASLGYDAIWSSSLTDSTQRCLPDIEILSPSDRLERLNEILGVCDLPLIYDADTGGKVEHFAIHVQWLARAGVSAIVIEDKCGLKKNSLLGLSVHQEQETVEHFCEKIRAGTQHRPGERMMIFARCESLILEKGLEDALARCSAYTEAGADGIMIHSRKRSGEEILEFARRFKHRHPATPLICVPTSYPQLTFSCLADAGFNAVIYANHMLRGAYSAMRQVATSILENDRAYEIEPACMPIDEILSLVPGTR
ncbi:phosphoenolpyruvate mutase [Pseudomonas entomophila]|uniref:phosphoenolpyruvate mutase n=1 Tax=Pseudomonas entomophila TaxID=312306 RepID=UPI002404AB00|nr:phosphoenolpyruvate mutase [Pseudomonas entomophila]MDF9616745.1 phosphoenolpyruvate mutase [Pseudomonas entomophila]